MSKFEEMKLYPVTSIRYEETRTHLSIIDPNDPYAAARALEQVDPDSDEIMNRFAYIKPGYEWSEFIGNVGFDCARLPETRRPQMCFFTLNKKQWAAVYYTDKRDQLRLAGYTCLGDEEDFK